MRLLVRTLAIALVLTLAFTLLGPMAPQGTLIREWAESFQEALNVWWGMPFGLPGT